MRKVAIALAILGAVGCTGGSAYGPSADDRLDMATQNVGTVQASGGVEDAVVAIEATDCPKLQAALVPLRTESDEESKLAALTGVLGRLQAATKTIREVIEERPGAAYFSGKTSDGMEHDIPVYTQACEAAFIDAEQSLGKLIRDILLAPVVEEFVGKRRRRSVAKPRVDLDLLATAIGVLKPTDQMQLMEEVDDAKDRLAKEKAEEKKPPRRRRRR